MSRPIFAAASLSIALLVAITARADEPEIDESTLTAVKSLTLRVTVKQAIGKFSSFQGLQAGDIFELDLNSLPKEKLRAISAERTPYIPLTGPLQFVKVRTSKPPANPPRTLLHLAAEGRGSRCLIRIVADSLQSGGKVYVALSTNDGFIGSMAEMEGAWK